MILIDTSIWIDHLHKTVPALEELLGLDRAGCHPLVVEEIALGSLRQRALVLELLGNLYQFPTIDHSEILHLTNERQLWGRGLGIVDVHLMAAVSLVPGARMWTRDKSLKTACAEAKIALFEEP